MKLHSERGRVERVKMEREREREREVLNFFSFFFALVCVRGKRDDGCGMCMNKTWLRGRPPRSRGHERRPDRKDSGGADVVIPPGMIA